MQKARGCTQTLFKSVEQGLTTKVSIGGKLPPLVVLPTRRGKSLTQGCLSFHGTRFQLDPGVSTYHRSAQVPF